LKVNLEKEDQQVLKEIKAKPEIKERLETQVHWVPKEKLQM
jgi:hypothetical protein